MKTLNYLRIFTAVLALVSIISFSGTICDAMFNDQTVSDRAFAGILLTMLFFILSYLRVERAYSGSVPLAKRDWLREMFL